MALDERDVIVLDDRNFDRMLGKHSVTLSSRCACLRSLKRDAASQSARCAMRRRRVSEAQGGVAV